jgi:uncharacterized protein YbjT (DUF2867 family)
MKRVLVVGGTGMLGGMCEALAARAVGVTVVSRGRQRPAWLAHRSIKTIHLDYTDTSKLRDMLAEQVGAHGIFDAAVCWIHSTAPEASEVVARAVAPCRYVRVMGSAGADPSRPNDVGRQIFGSIEGLRYQEVILGFEVEGTRSRWLTDTEISAGVLGALNSGVDRAIVGRVRPWSARP